MNIEIIPFDEKYAKDFYELNASWLQQYFYIEPYDEKVLSNPKTYIIDKGGYIFFAKFDETIVGTVAIIFQESFYELSKMAVSSSYRGQKIGQYLMDYCIDFSKQKKWEHIILYSHRKLIPAINMYKKVGFKEIALEKDSHYERSNIKMKLDL